MSTDTFSSTESQQAKHKRTIGQTKLSLSLCPAPSCLLLHQGILLPWSLLWPCLFRVWWILHLCACIQLFSIAKYKERFLDKKYCLLGIAHIRGPEAYPNILAHFQEVEEAGPNRVNDAMFRRCFGVMGLISKKCDGWMEWMGDTP